MSVFVCEGSGCSNDATIHLSHIENRVLGQEKWVCQNHAIDVLDHFLRMHSLGEYVAPAIQGITGFVPVDLHLSIYDQKLFHEGTSCWVYLAEIGGVRRLGVPTGYFETSNLEWELRGQAFRRPPTHRIVSELIRATGGRLEYALVDDYQEEEQLYGAKLHIAYARHSLKLDVRPSDAFTVAVACNAPILVSNDVLEKAGRSPET